MIPRLLLEGRVIYLDIRCFYGPLGYWLNAGVGWFLGSGPDAMGLAGTLRFGLMLVLLWQLARRLLSPGFAVLAMVCGTYGLSFSFVTPYSAGIGWGALFLVGGLLCMARPLGAVPMTPAGEPDREEQSASVWWSVAAATIFSLMASTKQEYAVTAATLIAMLIVTHLVCPGARRRGARLAAIAVAAILPFSLIAGIVLARVPAAVVFYDNLWIPELMEYLGGATNYCLDYLSKPSNLTVLLELTMLLTAAISAISLISSGDRRRQSWIALFSSLLIACIVEWYARSLPHSSANVFSYPKPRLRELIEASPMLCLPLSLSVIALLGWNAWKAKSAHFWNRISGTHRLGIVCTVVYLGFTLREIPTAVALLRQPVTPILLAWLLAAFVPLTMRWQGKTRRVWAWSVGLLLLAGAACGIDNMRFYLMRPATMLKASAGSMYAWQRRQPFTPAWFEGALQLVHAHRDAIEEGTLACVPEGAWINALTGLPWPMRDTQWMPYLQAWIAEDLDRTPPDFLLVMEPGCIAELTRIVPIIDALYIPIDTNSMGMTLYQHRSVNRIRGNGSDEGR